MKILTCFSILALVILLSSCNLKSVDNGTESSAMVSPDSLIGLWNLAWNKTDSITISNMFTKETQLVFSSNKRIIGGDSIMIKWIRTNLPTVRNLKTEKYIATATNDMAYYSGGYSLDMVRNDSVIGTDIGCFTAIWKKQEDKNWKIELMFFGVGK
ncbi:MAG: nuclear transport factor 2 family protein [Saprospiraceae bacterium]|nr:nuclear transport factor 2 family protein [Saprospiraceae bacterium]